MLVQNVSELVKLTKDLPSIISVDTETDISVMPKLKIEGYSFAYYKKGKIVSAYVPINHSKEELGNYINIDEKIAIKILKKIVGDRTIVFHNSQFDLNVLSEYGIDIPLGKFEDTLLAHWVIDTERKHGLKDIMKLEYNIDVVKYDEAKSGGFKSFSKYADNDARFTLFLWKKLKKELDSLPRTKRLYYKYELPFVEVLRSMNYRANYIRVDRDLLGKYIERANRELLLVKKDLEDKFGDINFNSNKQLGDALFTLGYPVEKNNPTPHMIKNVNKKGVEAVGNWKIGKKDLDRLYDKTKGIELEMLMYYRKLEKLSSTYLSPIYDRLEKVDKDVYVLTGYEFGHIGARSGRLNSYNPNMQNQPREPLLLKYMFITQLKKRKVSGIKNSFDTEQNIFSFIDDFSKKSIKHEKAINKLQYLCSIDIRSIFIPMKNKKFIGADFSQIELRMVAHLSKDKKMLDAFFRGDDIHQNTANQVASLIHKEVKRSYAKTLNFGLIYGLYYKSLANSTGMSVKDAKEMYNGYFRTYSQIQEFIRLMQSKARKGHYVETILGRRRNMNTIGINSSDFMRKNHAENATISTIVSGSASDLIKIAMINIFNELKDARIVLQIHDELLLEVDENICDKIEKQVIYYMENAIKLRVPVLVDSKIGNNWREVH